MERHRRGHQFALAALAFLVAIAAIAAGARHLGDARSREDGGSQASAASEALLDERMGALREAGAQVEEELVAGDIAEVAESLLEGYRRSRTALLTQAGFLDLAGSVWSCTVVQPEGVDLCFVEEREAGACVVRLVHLDEGLAADVPEGI